jgi:uncharacterized membrane protein YgdD (TMEM256/DUF423 family)
VNRTFLLLGGLFGALAVALGAFGAHGLRDRVDAQTLDTWQTAAHYHLIHAVMLVLIAVLRGHTRSKAVRVAGWLFVVGILIFGGTLYTLVLTGHKWLGAITPIGGACLIAGWLCLAIAGVRWPDKKDEMDPEHDGKPSR